MLTNYRKGAVDGDDAGSRRVEKPCELCPS